MENIRRSATTVACTVLLGAAWLTAAGAAAAVNADSTGSRILSYSDMVKLTARTEAQLEAAKGANEKYKDVNKALADGYVQVSPDVPGEGFHYLNPKLLDCTFNAAHPPQLLYALLPGHTRLRLVALEYAIPYACMPKNGPPPKGFAGNLDVWRNDAPVPFWLVAAWLYLKNPDGLFGSKNPLVP